MKEDKKELKETLQAKKAMAGKIVDAQKKEVQKVTDKAINKMIEEKTENEKEGTDAIANKVVKEAKAEETAATARQDVLKSIQEELEEKLHETPPSQNQPPTAVVQIASQVEGFEDEVYHI